MRFLLNNYTYKYVSNLIKSHSCLITIRHNLIPMQRPNHRNVCNFQRSTGTLNYPKKNIHLMGVLGLSNITPNKDAYQVWKFRIDEKCLSESSMTSDEWQTIINERPRDHARYSNFAFDTFIIRECLKNNNLPLSLSYMKYLESRNEKLNFVALGSCLVLLAKNINTINEEIFLNVYKQLKEEKYLPALIIEKIIEALSFTKYYFEAGEYIKLLEKDQVNIIYRSHNFIARALTREKGFQSAFQYIESVHNKSDHLHSEICVQQETISSLLLSLKTLSNKDQHLEAVFNLLQKCEEPLNEDNVQILSSVMPHYWKTSKVRILNGELCSICSSQLLDVPLDNTTFNILKEECEAKAVQGVDIFQQTTPEEWSAFQRFLKINAPFDIVVDGLNVFYYLKSDIQVGSNSFFT